MGNPCYIIRFTLWYLFVWCLGKKYMLILAIVFMCVKLDLMGVWEQNVKKNILSQDECSNTNLEEFPHWKLVIISYSLPNVITVVIKGGLKMRGRSNMWNWGLMFAECLSKTFRWTNVLEGVDLDRRVILKWILLAGGLRDVDWLQNKSAG